MIIYIAVDKIGIVGIGINPEILMNRFPRCKVYSWDTYYEVCDVKHDFSELTPYTGEFANELDNGEVILEIYNKGDLIDVILL